MSLLMMVVVSVEVAEVFDELNGSGERVVEAGGEEARAGDYKLSAVPFDQGPSHRGPWIPEILRFVFIGAYRIFSDPPPRRPLLPFSSLLPFPGANPPLPLSDVLI